MRFRFLPNPFAKEKFRLTENEYVGDGMTPLLETVLGKENYRRHMIAQDPLCGGKTSGNITIILNPGELDTAKMKFESIGAIFQINSN